MPDRKESRMLLPKAATIIAAVLFLGATGTLAEKKPIAASDIPRRFEGQYKWRKEGRKYSVVLTIDKVKDKKDGTIRFSGSHAYSSGDYTMAVDGTIDTDDRSITMHESDPTNPNSEVEGFFEGTISDDLKTIEAVWTTKSSGLKGDLKVKAKH